MTGELLSVAILAVIIGCPFFLASLSSRRGIRTDKPTHPFKLPPEGSFFLPTSLPGFEDPYRQEYLEIPPTSVGAPSESGPPTRRHSRRPRQSLSYSVASFLRERHVLRGLCHVLAVLGVAGGGLLLLAALFSYAWR